MKPFNLERAIAGDPVETVRGKPVYQLTVFDCDEPYNIVGIVDNNLYRWDKKGISSSSMAYDGDNDLVMTPIKKTGFVNLYEDNKGNIITAAEKVCYASSWARDDALMREEEVGKYIATVKVEWEE